MDGDNANLDEFANYYGVTAVCAVNERDTRSSYSEMGANLWVCALGRPRTGLPGYRPPRRISTAMWTISAGHLGQPPRSLIKELPSSTPSNSLYEASKNRTLPRAPRIPHGSWSPPGTRPEHPSGTRGTSLPGNGVPRSPTRRSSRCAAQRLAAPSPAGPSTVSVTCGSAFPRCLWDSLDLRYREHSERKRLQIEYLESFF